MYSNSYCSYKFAPKQEKIGQSSHKEYSNNILKHLEFTAIINACTKKVWKLIECTSYHFHFFSIATQSYTEKKMAKLYSGYSQSNVVFFLLQTGDIHF